MFESLERKPPDAILKLIAEYGQDTRKEKIDLGVGIYRDADGNTPILRAVKTAERRLLDTQTSKSYLGVRGATDFCAAQQAIVLGDKHRDNDRVMTLQTPGGSGALRVAAGVILRANPDTTLWFSEPTWNNHVPLLGGAGLKLASYPYYDAAHNTLQFDAMRRSIERIPAGDVVLLHGCCHNPTGMDLSPGQWDAVADLVAERGLLPFVDIAYQGFADGLDEDTYGLRRIFDCVPEMLIAASCSKNFGLYRDRVGSLTFLSSSADASDTVSSQALNIVRTMYSLPPDHGAAAVTMILNDKELRSDWIAELDGMRVRMKEMRKLLVAALARSAPGHDFSHIEKGNGLFCYLGVTPEQVAILKRDFGVYLVETGRINVCGINDDNVDYLGDSVAAVL